MVQLLAKLKVALKMRLWFVIQFSVLCQLRRRSDQLHCHPFLLQDVCVILGSSWKLTSPKTLILQDVYPVVQPLWWRLTLFTFSVLPSHSISISKIEVLVERGVNGVHKGQFLHGMGLQPRLEKVSCDGLAKPWKSPWTFNNLLEYPAPMLPCPSGRFFLSRCLIWNSQAAISDISRELKLQLHCLVLNMKIKYEKKS